MEPAQEKAARNFSVTVPPVACSFAWKNHPDALKLKELSDAWVVERCKNLPAACRGQQAALIFSPESLVGSAFHLLATLFFPNAASVHVLLPIVKMMSWIVMLDSFVDDPSEMSTHLAETERLIDNVAAVFEASPAGGQAECVRLEPMSVHDVLADSAREWWEEMKLNTSPSLQARFSTLFTTYLKANRLQVPFRAGLEMPDLETYFRLRTGTVCWYPQLPLIESCLSIELDQEALAHPLLINLQRNVCEQIILVNDITSFGKEYTQGDLFNVVFLVCFSELGLRKLPGQNWQALLSQDLLQESVRKVSDMIKNRHGECVRVIEEIRGSPVLMSKVGMEAYLEGLGHNLAGNVYWHFISALYGVRVPTDANGHPDLLAPFQVYLAI